MPAGSPARSRASGVPSRYPGDVMKSTRGTNRRGSCIMMTIVRQQYDATSFAPPAPGKRRFGPPPVVAEHGRVDVAVEVDLGRPEDPVVDQAELRLGEDRVHVGPGDRPVAVRRPAHRVADERREGRRADGAELEDLDELGGVGALGEDRRHLGHPEADERRLLVLEEPRALGDHELGLGESRPARSRPVALADRGAPPERLQAPEARPASRACRRRRPRSRRTCRGTRRAGRDARGCSTRRSARSRSRRRPAGLPDTRRTARARRRRPGSTGSSSAPGAFRISSCSMISSAETMTFRAAIAVSSGWTAGPKHRALP